MLLNQDNTILESNTENDSNQFGIGDMGVVLDILTRLYSNPIQTLTQEYISNARDAMRENNNTNDNIEITLPTKINPSLKIRDYGLGLSQERIKTVFLLYGNSTKRDTNNQTGGFGIGAKSAWSYTDSFMVTSFHKGLKTSYLCHKSNFNGNMDKLEEISTLEKNGVEIEIAINPADVRLFHNAVNRTIMFWDNKPKILNADKVDFKINEVDTYKLTNDLHFGDRYELKVSNANCLLVIDGIPYQMKSNITSKIKNFDNLKNMLRGNTFPIFFINNGQIEIAPSREEIIDNDKTIKTLEKIVKIAYLKTIKEIDNQFKKCKSLKDTIKVYGELYKKFNIDRKYGNYTLSGNEIKNDNFCDYTDDNDRRCSWVKPDRAYLKTKEYHRDKVKIENDYTKKLYVDDILNNTIYYNDLNESVININKRVRTFLDNSKSHHIILVDTEKEDLIKELDAKPLSSLEKKSTPKREKGEKIVENGKLFVHIKVSYCYTQKYLTLDELLEKPCIVYFTYDEKDYNDQLKRYLYRNNITVLTGSKKVLNTIKTLKNSMPLERFIKRYKVDNNLYYIDYVARNLAERRFLNNFKNFKDDIKNKKITSMFKYLDFQRNFTKDLPNELIKIDKKTKLKIDKFNKINDNWNEFKGVNFGILNELRCYDKNDKKEFIDLLNYKLSK